MNDQKKRKKYVKTNMLKKGYQTRCKFFPQIHVPFSLSSRVPLWDLYQAASYSNISKRCLLCLHEKLAIVLYPNPGELINKRSEMISKCRHLNKFLLMNFNSNN